MRLPRSFLHRIPEPSIRLFLVLVLFSAVAVMCLVMLSGSVTPALSAASKQIRPGWDSSTLTNCRELGEQQTFSQHCS
jgi:hypothetical protein